MGLTERHWFEYEDTPENYEWNLEDAVRNSCINKKADMVEVVRCKNCIQYNQCAIQLKFADADNPGNWFCAYGRRRNSDD